MASLAMLAPLLVGAILLLAGFAKALMPGGSLRYLQLFGLRQPILSGVVLVIWLMLELSLGAALLLSWRPPLALPAGLLMTLALAVVNAAVAWRGALGAHGCGCFGGIIDLSPRQAIWLNLFCALALLLAMQSPPEPAATGVWVALLASLGTGLALVSLLYQLRQQRPWFEPGPIKRGRHWNPAWLPTPIENVLHGEHLIVFLSADCTVCKHWLRPLNVTHGRAGMPQVTAVLDGDAAAFASRYALQFEVLAMAGRPMARLAPLGHPFAALLNEGQITETWYGSMPASFVARLRGRS